MNATPSKRVGHALQLGGSLTATLPADWVRGHGLKAGDELMVEYDADSVTVRPKRPTRENP